MTTQKRNIREKWVIFKRIIHDYNYWKESKDSKRVCDYTNSNVKTFEMPKNINES